MRPEFEAAGNAALGPRDSGAEELTGTYPAAADGSSAGGAHMRAAAIEAFAESGYAATSVASICARAGIPESGFHEIFVDKEEAFVSIFEEEAKELLERCRGVYVAEPEWASGLRALGVELVAWVLEHPDEARLLAVESLAAGESVRLRREGLVGAFAELVDQGRYLLEDPDSVPHGHAVAVAGAVIGLLVRALSRPGPPTPSRLARRIPELMYFALRPYVGDERAARELALGAPR